MRPLLVAFVMLTRLPVRVQGEIDDRDLSRAAAFFPAVGAVVGAFVAAVYLVLPTAPLISAILAIAAGILLTGAFHEDALGDMADGFGGGWDKQAVLRIMRDSRQGTYGVVAIVLSVALQVVCLSELSGWRAALWLVAAHGISRAVPPVLMRMCASARPDGFVARMRVSDGAVWVAVGLAVLLGLPLGWWALLAWLAAALCGVGIAWATHRRIGGLTGDVAGAAQQLALLSVLILGSIAG